MPKNISVDWTLQFSTTAKQTGLMCSEERLNLKFTEQKARESEPSYQRTLKVCLQQEARKAQLSPNGDITTCKSL